MRYEYGMFAQSIDDGRQVEVPTTGCEDGTPWEWPRPS
jgi:glycogen phosphorylase